MSYETTQQPPSKASLRAWWNSFTFPQRAKKEAEAQKPEPVHTVFGKPLKESLRYASVQISTADANGELYVWGYIPVVVAKCGLYLKENATEVEGTFRVNGSAKRMRELQAAFEAPPRYGKNLDWKQEVYTTHDVASVFRRYLTQMPFREPLAKDNYNTNDVVTIYRQLIRKMPRANAYLLLYVLDILSVFARKADKNLMTATNLAVIFRPGILSHPSHEMSPAEHAPSQRVLEFLIAHQDWFMNDVPPPRRSDRAQKEGYIPSSDEEQPHGGGNWNMGPEKPSRPLTTYGNARVKVGPFAEADMAPAPEPGLPASGTVVSVIRSRTLPASRVSRRGGAGENGTPLDRARVLRKQKRASSSQPSRTGTLESRD
ncbi:hypothetical protein AX16_002661 [Volvariella volvacea WC 439]|nr:hypothetical protein AX16_002661 [Volvariella volvacea WC 439]